MLNASASSSRTPPYYAKLFYFNAIALAMISMFAVSAEAADPIQPTHANVPYGEHPRQVLDVYLTKSSSPTPWVFYVHGGGWQAGDKKVVQSSQLPRMLAAGMSVVSINYRFVTEANEKQAALPIEWPLFDARRALQFCRTKASEWNLDPQRVGGMGSSAGAVTSLWLGLHDDMADPKSSDPIARQSTRLASIAVQGAQTSLDPKQFTEWVPNASYGAPAFGFPRSKSEVPAVTFAKFLDARDKLLPVIRQFSAYDLITPDDPPILLEYSSRGTPGREAADAAHVDVHGIMFVKRAQEVRARAELAYPTAAQPMNVQSVEFLAKTMKAEAAK